MRRIFLFLTCILLTACSGADLLNATVPHSGYTLESDVPYGPLPRQKLDIYKPAMPDASHAIVVFFYGGSWQSGSKDMYRFVAQALAARGYMVAIPDYRLYPEVKYPAFLEDAARAVAWMHSHSAAYGGNADNLFLAGHSAGGYIAIMLALNDTYLKAAGYDAHKLRGAIGLAGPYDFLPITDPKLKDIFSTAPAAQTQPLTYAGAGKPPLLLLHGDADEEVRLKNSINLEARQREFHSPAELHVLPGVGHYGIILGLSGLFRSKSPTLDEMDAFLSRHALCPPQ